MADQHSSPSDGPWSDLTDDLLDLTQRLRSTYRRAAAEDGPSEDEIRAAFSTLAGAWNQMAGSVAAAVQDPEVRSHLKRAASSLVAAVSATVSEFSPAREGAPSGSEPDQT